MSDPVKMLSNLLSTVASITQLATVGGFYSSLNMTVLLVGHCLTVARLTKGANGSATLLNFIMGFLMAFGGGIASSLLLGSPANAPNPFFSNTIFTIFTLCWWATNFCPGDPIGTVMEFKPVAALAAACLQVLRGTVTADRVAVAAARFPGAIGVALLAGALGGAGGKIITEFIGLATGTARGTWEVAAPTYVLRSTLVGAATYYLTVIYLGALSAVEGKALIVTLFAAHSLAGDLLGYNFDYTGPITEVFLTVTQIGGSFSLFAPPAAAPSARGRSRSKSAPSTPRAASADAAAAAPPSGGRGRSRGRTPRRAAAKKSE